MMSHARDGNKDITIATTVSLPRNRILIYIGKATGFVLNGELQFWDYSDATTGNNCFVKDESATTCAKPANNYLANCDLYALDQDTCETCAVGYWWDGVSNPKLCDECHGTCFTCTAGGNTDCVLCKEGVIDANGECKTTVNISDVNCLRVVIVGSDQ